MAKTFQRINENIFKLREEPEEPAGQGGSHHHRLEEALVKTVEIMHQAAMNAKNDEMKSRELIALFERFSSELQSGQ